MTTKLFVRSLAFQTTSDTIHRAFAPFGQLAEAKVATEREDPSKSRGFAFVSYFNPDDAARAKEQMDGTEIDGRRIIVDFSTPPGAAPMAGGGGQTRQLAPPAAQAPRAAYPPPGASAPPSGRGRSRSPPRHQAPPARYQAPAAAAPPAREPDVARIYVTGLPKGTTEDALAAHFGVIGQIARKKQKRGYPDQWPWNIRLYTDEKGAFKGDATVTFEDPNAAANAPKFFDGGDFKGNTIHVEVASASQAR